MYKNWYFQKVVCFLHTPQEAPNEFSIKEEGALQFQQWEEEIFESFSVRRVISISTQTTGCSKRYEIHSGFCLLFLVYKVRKPYTSTALTSERGLDNIINYNSYFYPSRMSVQGIKSTVLVVSLHSTEYPPQY